MKQPWLALLLLSAAMIGLPMMAGGASKDKTKDKTLEKEFRTSDRCVACHNELQTSSGEDISIGFQWRASVMANVMLFSPISHRADTHEAAPAAAGASSSSL